MVADQRIFLHPRATPMARGHWTTTAWNAAWLAANAADGCDTRIVEAA